MGVAEYRLPLIESPLRDHRDGFRVWEVVVYLPVRTEIMLRSSLGLISQLGIKNVFAMYKILGVKRFNYRYSVMSCRHR